MDMVELMTRGPGLFGIGSENPTLRSCSFRGTLRGVGPGRAGERGEASLLWPAGSNVQAIE
jgi:hypothetical protein